MGFCVTSAGQRGEKSGRLAAVVSGVPLLFLKAKSYLLRLIPIHPTNTKNEHADAASEVAKEVIEVINTEQLGGLSCRLKGAHPNPPEKCAKNSGVVLGRVDSSQV